MDAEDQIYIQNILRQGTIKWRGRNECLKRARKRVLVRHSKAGKPIFKFHWQCAVCKEWTKNEKEMEVDHIVEIGSFCGNWDIYVRKVYCGQENLQAVCVKCHMKKTKKFNSAESRWKRKIKE